MLAGTASLVTGVACCMDESRQNHRVGTRNSPAKKPFAEQGDSLEQAARFDSPGAIRTSMLRRSANKVLGAAGFNLVRANTIPKLSARISSLKGELRERK